MSEFSSVVFLQIAVILAMVRVVGAAAKRVGQPQVVGEMIAGVVMGPSLFGWWFPDVQAALFPKSSVAILHGLSQLGLVIYMFLAGAEFNRGFIRRKIHSAASVSIAGITAPFVLASVLTFYLYKNPDLFTPGVSIWVAMLFMGAAMSITAFPVLARIIAERGLTGTSLGNLVMAAGAVNDAAAWCIFAFVLAISGGNSAIGLVTVGGGAAYAIVAWRARWSLYTHIGAKADHNKSLSGPMLSVLLMLLMLASWFTDIVGIHAVFGAFVLGVVMPRGVVTRDLQRYLEPAATNFLVPLFFVYSGLNTNLGLVVTPELWGITLIVILVACVGKGGACWLAARLNGEGNRVAMAVGALMNARGLMELILLNIALERGIITPVLFASMVIMAVTTTVMTSPLYELISRRYSALGKEGALAGDKSLKNVESLVLQ
jgi:Kef-type K+ transport system membrane component KefB